MNTIRCLVVDDEPLALEQMATYVGKTPFLTLVGKCCSAEEASKLISMENVDAMFVDINMPDLNGLDFVRSLVAPPKRQFELEHRAVMQVDDVVFFKTEHRVVKVKVADISYVEGMGEYLKIYVGDNKPLVVLLSMKRIEERLPSWFMRIHRSYIVNLHKINEVNKNRVILDADTFLPIGDSYRENFMGYLNTRFMG